jgi:predicted dithiol-disulfide oxidoreductase (DUF899 family)
MDKPWEVEGCTDAELAEAYFNSWQSAHAAIAEKDKEIERLKKDSDRYRKLRRMHCNEFQNIYVASLNGNRSFDELVDGIQTILLDDNMIDDGFGNSWSKTCPMCHMQTMQIVRPGKAQCSICG